MIVTSFHDCDCRKEYIAPIAMVSVCVPRLQGRTERRGAVAAAAGDVGRASGLRAAAAPAVPRTNPPKRTKTAARRRGPTASNRFA